MEFPPNSHKARAAQGKPKPKIESVVPADAVRRKRPSLGKQFKNTFFSGDVPSMHDHVIGAVVVPMLRDLLFEAGQTAWGLYVYRNTGGGGRRRMGGPPSGPGGPTNYAKYGATPPGGSPGPRVISQQSRARQEFDEIILSERTFAEEVVERMYDLVDQFEVATLADLYSLVGIRAEHTDEKWGWTDMTGARVDRLRGNAGFLLDLPKPEPLN